MRSFQTGVTIAAALFIGLLSGAAPVRAEETSLFSPMAEIAGKTVTRQGTGTRKATLFAIRVYDAAFYSTAPAATLMEVLALPNPKRLDIRYARDFDLKQTKEAWVYQFRESSDTKPEQIEKELDLLVSFQKEIKEGDVHRFDLKDGVTEFSINGEKRGEIPGIAFQRALLTIFFGPNPPTKDLQKGLYNR